MNTRKYEHRTKKKPGAKKYLDYVKMFDPQNVYFQKDAIQIEKDVDTVCRPLLIGYSFRDELIKKCLQYHGRKLSISFNRTSPMNGEDYTRVKS